jgi:formylglycine-generating enzyme required for sulfatase activity
MIRIPAGEFLMGSDPVRDGDALDREQPQHRPYLPEYHIGKAPVTNEQYLAFVQATDREHPSHWEEEGPPEGKEDHPVVYVTWDDAMAYCQWLTEETGRLYTLPSEAEWEKAASWDAASGRKRIYPWGDEWDETRCNTEESGIGDTTPVGVYPQGASPYGLVDMAGNVFEWTRSLWGNDLPEPDFKYPYDPADGREDTDVRGLRVVRGGSWNYSRTEARCTARYRPDPFTRHRHIGFRVCVAAQRE